MGRQLTVLSYEGDEPRDLYSTSYGYSDALFSNDAFGNAKTQLLLAAGLSDLLIHSYDETTRRSSGQTLTTAVSVFPSVCTRLLDRMMTSMVTTLQSTLLHP